MTLWNFHGGLRLAPHKAESTHSPPRAAPLPERLILPLQRRDGRTAEPLIEPGDRVLKGQIIAGGGDDPSHPPIHASTSGVVLAIEPHPLPHPSGLSDLCVVIEADGEDAAAEFEPPLDHRDCEPAELLRRIHRAGVVGLGGAGFPTAVKAAPGPGPIATLILNGAECEPYITCDETLLRHRAEDVLRGGDILRHILRAERVLLAIENDMPEAIAAARLARQALGLENIDIVPVPAIYPTGGERQLIRVLTGLEVPARGIPADIGVVCQNVGTAAAVYRAVALGEPLLSRLVTVTGRGIRQPQNLEVRLGTPIAELAGFCGGYTDAAERLIMGGPMMGFALASDVPPVVKSTNCVLVAGRGELGAAGQPQPCIRCGACAEVCPANLLPQQLYWYSRSEQLDRALDYRLADCIECGCCDVVCPSHIPLVQYFRATKGKVLARQRERDSADHARVRFEARQVRKVEEARERADAAKRKKANLEKGARPEIKQAIERAKQKRAEKLAAGQESRAEVDTST
jgi:electron transport complex protein RnfC